ncbi:MAG: hypothetical protein VYA21_01070, partial [Verrucomicrobiota bacterium]|nr:hypothetical protein [Verrucomicrobiota bacterium]
DEGAMPLSDDVLVSARHVMKLNVSLVEAVKTDLAARVKYLVKEDDRKDRHRYRIGIKQRRYFWSKWRYAIQHRFKRETELIQLAHTVRISLLPDELQLGVYEHRQILSTFVRRGGIFGCNPLTWLKSRLYKIYVVDRVGACKYEIGKKKHGLSPWQLSALANVIESFTFLYLSVATAGILWYTINVKDNYLISSVLYTTITNMIISIFLTGPMYHLLLDGFIPAMASFLVRTDVLRYLQEEELQNVNREEGDSDSDSETDDRQIEALESGTKNIKLVASQTNPMLLVGASGDLLHTPSDLDAMSPAERQKIVSRMTLKERDALKERETRQALSLVSESV